LRQKSESGRFSSPTVNSRPGFRGGCHNPPARPRLARPSHWRGYALEPCGAEGCREVPQPTAAGASDALFWRLSYHPPRGHVPARQIRPPPRAYWHATLDIPRLIRGVSCGLTPFWRITRAISLRLRPVTAAAPVPHRAERDDGAFQSRSNGKGGKASQPKGVVFPSRPLCGALAGLACYYGRFERCALTPKTLMALARTADPSVRSQDRMHQGNLAQYAGSYPPQPLTTIPNRKRASLYRKVALQSAMRSEPPA
jgi:hypothetical protein